jgi:hypothetical protein
MKFLSAAFRGGRLSECPDPAEEVKQKNEKKKLLSTAFRGGRFNECPDPAVSSQIFNSE